MPKLALSLAFANAIVLSAAPVDAVRAQEADHEAIRATSYVDGSYRITAFAQNEDERLEIAVTRDASAWVATAWATQGADLANDRYGLSTAPYRLGGVFNFRSAQTWALAASKPTPTRSDPLGLVGTVLDRPNGRRRTRLVQF